VGILDFGFWILDFGFWIGEDGEDGEDGEKVLSSVTNTGIEGCYPY
jgi:hypothetical protein